MGSKTLVIVSTLVGLGYMLQVVVYLMLLNTWIPAFLAFVMGVPSILAPILYRRRYRIAGMKIYLGMYPPIQLTYQRLPPEKRSRYVEEIFLEGLKLVTLVSLAGILLPYATYLIVNEVEWGLSLTWLLLAMVFGVAIYGAIRIVGVQRRYWGETVSRLSRYM